MIPVVEGDKVVIVGVNETPDAWKGKVRYGYFKLAGGLPIDETTAVELPPNAATVIGEMPRLQWESLGTSLTGAFALLLKDNRPVSQNRIFVERFKDLKWATSDIRVERKGEKAVFSSPTFIWAVCLDVDGEAPISDDVFDLLPGIGYEIDWPSDKPLTQVQRTASPL